ncbi:small G protein signaling modulator 1 [Plakobranchus ocellatus]|uniref:Small G protein signaling modulator 1 n=1 Tax=Plakobranchus ocellatus TaxID=259542 RepID=A0AAV4A161_9GAST|nr:small G protein signaling modulator 1 [Plakobranchus ocellatus]
MASEAEERQRLLRAVKKEVKQIMEEAVTRKFVHEESSSLTSLCGPPSGQSAGGWVRTWDRRVPANLKADSQSTALQTPPKDPETEWDRKNKQ